MSDVVEADVDRMRVVADVLERRAEGAAAFVERLGEVGRRLEMQWDVWAPLQVASEIDHELRAAATVLRTRAELAELIDGGRSNEALQMVFANQVEGLRLGVDDLVGATGGDDDRRALLERRVFGIGGAPRQPERVHVDPSVWIAEHVTGPVLDGAGSADAVAYWELLTPDERLAVIIVVPGAVGDRVTLDGLELEDYEMFALQVQPVPTEGRQPTRQGADWAGVEIPIPDETTSGAVAGAVEDAENAGADWRSVAGGTVLCDAIQFGSTLPSRPESGLEVLGETGRTVVGASKTISSATTPFEIFSPANWVATLADISLCRLRLGSGAPISTNQIVNDDGELVYESSHSQHKFQDGFGVTLSPNPETRDRQIWQATYPMGTPEYRPYPEDEYPVFGPDGSFDE